jgi:transcriptional/translational regulatory protein YebC/TACO1
VKIFRDAFQKESAAIKAVMTELSYIPTTTTDLDDAAFESLCALVEEIEGDDDVQHVYHNAVQVSTASQQ